jgi:hypothetical protein
MIAEMVGVHWYIERRQTQAREVYRQRMIDAIQRAEVERVLRDL